MILRPRALVAEPSTWLAALICCGLCALAWFGYRATDQWQRSAALLADHRGREAADLLTRALTRDMSGVQTSILNSPEQNRHAFDPPVRGQRSRRAGLRALSIPGVFLRLDAVERGHGDVRPHRSAAGLDRRRPTGRRLSRRGPARSAGNCGAAPAGRTRHRQAPAVFGVRDVNRRRSVPGCRAAHL